MYIKLTNFQKRTAELFLLSLNGSKTSKRIITTANGQMEPESQAIITRIPGGWTADKKPEQIVERVCQHTVKVEQHDHASLDYYVTENDARTGPVILFDCLCY